MKTEHRSSDSRRPKPKPRPSVGKDYKDPHNRSSGSSGSSTPAASTSKQIDVAKITLNAMKYEEEEAMSRNLDQDLGLFSKTCDEIRDLLKEMKSMKASNEAEEKINETKKSIFHHFLSLKKLNRYDKIRCKNARDKVNSVKQKVDSFDMHLQNLYYEVRYLQKETSRNTEFRSKDESIDLVSVTDFYKEAPEEISKPDETRNDSHKLTLARLEWELVQRKKLTQTLQEKIGLKKKYIEQIEVQKADLDDLKPMIKGVIDVTQPILPKLGIPLQSTELQHSSTEYLPPSLYMLYVQMCAYNEANEKKLFIKINGNVDEAKSLNFSLDDNDDERVESDVDEKKGKRHRKSFSSKKIDIGWKKLTTAHPLSVSVVVTDPQTMSKLTMEFSFMMLLKIIATKVYLSSTVTNANRDILGPTLLHELFLQDDSKSSPNPANVYHLQRFGHSLDSVLKEIGYAYKWAQKLAGLNFLSQITAKGEISRVNSTDFLQGSLRSETNATDSVVSIMGLTITAINNRFKSRISLQQHLSDLERGIISLPTELAEKCYDKLCCTLKEWSTTTWEDIKKHPHAYDMLNSGVMSESWFPFKGKIERSSAQLNFNVAISPSYPDESPIFTLTLKWQTEKTSKGDSCLRDLEEYINISCVQMMEQNQRFDLLIFQMHNLCVGFDVFLETEQASTCHIEGPKEFPQTKIFPRLLSGRDHSRPYYYSSKYNFFTTK